MCPGYLFMHAWSGYSASQAQSERECVFSFMWISSHCFAIQAKLTDHIKKPKINCYFPLPNSEHALMFEKTELLFTLLVMDEKMGECMWVLLFWFKHLIQHSLVISHYRQSSAHRQMALDLHKYYEEVHLKPRDNKPKSVIRVIA